MLINEKYNVDGAQFQKFDALKKIVEEWYYNQIEVINGTPDMRKFVIMYDYKEYVESIYAGIHRSNLQSGAIRITPILNYYNQEGSTRYVFGFTTKPVIETVKSHVNYVAAEEDSWQELATRCFENNENVVKYVRNQYLGFHIPYYEISTEKKYSPDFIVEIEKPDGGKVNLIVEISHFHAMDSETKDNIRKYITSYWIEAVNAIKTYGKWDFVEINDMDRIDEIIAKKINEL